LAAGAKDYLTKPLDQSEVLLRIRNLLENRFLHIQLQNQNILLEEQVRERTAQLEDTLSKLRLAQHTAIKQERLSALGTMAAGIAHDFNNALTLILGYSDLLLSNCKDRPDGPETEQIKAVTTAARDAAQIVKRLREFHRPDDGAETRVALQLNSLIEQAVTMTRPRWKDEARAQGREVSVRCELNELPPLMGDPAELREMLTNLIFNAVDAMPDGGEITIRTAQEESTIRLCLADTGMGMDEETRRRCLEPFFTTKGERGSGLGLSAVYGIIERHGGTMEIESEQGKGTSFCISLPAALDAETPHEQAEQAREPDSILRILLVDDQPIILDVLQQQLAEDGHEIVTAGSGPEALAVLAEKGCDLVMTDQSMPGMTGDELAALIKQKSPKTAVILLTGFGGSESDNDERPSGVDMIVGKPATSVDLRRAIVQVLSS
jgi:signal transduction histidine kinase/ActR/RegA family two-component response regulator